jgi:hypothetical protein
LPDGQPFFLVTLNFFTFLKVNTMNSSFNKARTTGWSASEDATAFANAKTGSLDLPPTNACPPNADPGQYLPESEDQQSVEDFKSFIATRLAKHKAPAHLLEQIKQKISIA